MTLAQVSIAGSAAQLVRVIFWALEILVLARVIISWLPNVSRYHPLVRFIYQATEPMLRPFRSMVRVGAGGLDFSPLILLLVLYVLEMLVLRVLFGV